MLSLLYMCVSFQKKIQKSVSMLLWFADYSHDFTLTDSFIVSYCIYVSLVFATRSDTYTYKVHTNWNNCSSWETNLPNAQIVRNREEEYHKTVKGNKGRTNYKQSKLKKKEERDSLSYCSHKAYLHDRRHCQWLLLIILFRHMAHTRKAV